MFIYISHFLATNSRNIEETEIQNPKKKTTRQKQIKQNLIRKQ